MWPHSRKKRKVCGYGDPEILALRFYHQWGNFLYEFTEKCFDGALTNQAAGLSHMAWFISNASIFPGIYIHHSFDGMI